MILLVLCELWEVLLYINNVNILSQNYDAKLEYLHRDKHVLIGIIHAGKHIIGRKHSLPLIVSVCFVFLNPGFCGRS